MDELTEFAAIKLLNAPVVHGFRIPAWFKPHYIQYLFPIDRRPMMLSHISSTPDLFSSPPTPSSEGGNLVLSKRREEDKVRRDAMHNLLTTWDKSAKNTARDLVNVLFRGHGGRKVEKQHCYGGLDDTDLKTVSRFLNLIPDVQADQAHSTLSEFRQRPDAVVHQPMFSLSGYSLTETVGPLAMLTRVCRHRIIVVVWVKERVRMSHGTRKVKMLKRQGRVVLFDRFFNLVFVPLGNANDQWQFIRGATVALVQVQN